MEDKDKARKKTSTVWKYCEILDDTYAICTICEHKLSYKSSVTNLRKHFRKKHPEIAVPATGHYSQNGNFILSDDDDNESKNETQRATNTVIVDYLRPAGEGTKMTPKREVSYSRPNIKRDHSPVRYQYHKEPKYKRVEESEFDIFGRSIVMQLKQLPLVSALELQAEIMNLMVQKRIQSLRQNHETMTEAPMQYALVYATEAPTVVEGTVESVEVHSVESTAEESTEQNQEETAKDS